MGLKKRGVIFDFIAKHPGQDRPSIIQWKFKCTPLAITWNNLDALSCHAKEVTCLIRHRFGLVDQILEIDNKNIFLPENIDPFFMGLSRQ